jgi:uncharacterized protein (DUF1330 family)
METCRSLAAQSIATHGGRYLVRGGAAEVVEGGPPPKTLIIVEFPSMARARQWYASAEYAEALKVRRTALVRRLRRRRRGLKEIKARLLVRTASSLWKGLLWLCAKRRETTGGETMPILRHAIFCLSVGLAAWLPQSPARADQAFQRFLPLFVDLDGWQGKKPDGMSMEMPNASMTTAARDYTRGPAQAHATVMVGQPATGALAPIQSGVNLQTSQGHMVTATMHGMQVLKTFNTPQKSGALMVALGKEAMFSFSYSGLSEDEGTALAEKFDWKALQAAAQTK